MEITEAATAWMMNGFARKWDVNFLSSFGLLSFYSELYQEVFNKAGLEGSEAA